MNWPASVDWLLAHELRLIWRGWFLKRTVSKRERRFRVPPILLVPLFLGAAMAFLGFPIASSLQGEPIVLNAFIVLLIDVVLAFVLTLMLSQTLVTAVQVFYERADLDLLLSSPLSPTRILAVRTFAMAVNPALLVWALATPFVIPFAILGHPQFLAAYLVLGAVALLAAGFGIGLALLLFKLVGPRRTKTVAQIFAAFVGAIFVVVANLPNIMGDTEDGGQWTRLANDAASGVWQAPDWATLPARAVFGEPLPLLSLVAFSLAVFVAVAVIVGRRFAQNAAAAQGAATAVRRRRGPVSETVRFRSGAFSAAVGKEFRLLRRDPALISQVLLRIFYLIPLTFVIFQNSDDAAGGLSVAWGAGGIALLAGQLAGSIAWVTISAEDSPQLLASSPVPIRFFWQAKLAATLIPPALMVIPAIVALALFDWVAALIGALGAAASAISAALVNLWLQKPARRNDFRRQWSSNFASSILELLLSLCWAAATGMAAFGTVWALAPAALAIAVLGFCYRTEAAMLERIATV